MNCVKEKRLKLKCQHSNAASGNMKDSQGRVERRVFFMSEILFLNIWFSYKKRSSDSVLFFNSFQQFLLEREESSEKFGKRNEMTKVSWSVKKFVKKRECSFIFCETFSFLFCYFIILCYCWCSFFSQR